MTDLDPPDADAPDPILRDVEVLVHRHATDVARYRWPLRVRIRIEGLVRQHADKLEWLRSLRRILREIDDRVRRHAAGIAPPRPRRSTHQIDAALRHAAIESERHGAITVAADRPASDAAPSEPPPLILHDVERLVHRRATEIARKQRPRRKRRIVGSALTGAIATCTVSAVVLIGSPGYSMANPQQTIAAAAKILDGNGILHWVRSTDDERRIRGGSAQRITGVMVEDEWIDLATADSHRTIEAPPDPDLQVWTERGVSWFTVPASDPQRPVIQTGPDPRPRARSFSIVDDILSALARAKQGTSRISEERSADGTPLVVITEHQPRIVRQLWLTTGDNPRVVRWTTRSASRVPGRTVTSTITTKVWEILPRTAASLQRLRIPANAVRIE